AEYYQTLRRRYPNDPKAAMWVIYKGRDETGNPQPINKVLTLDAKHEAWEQAVYDRVPNMDKEIVSCVKSFYGSLDHYSIKAGMADIIELTLQYFKGYEDVLLPNLPKNTWHLVAQEKTKLSEDLLTFLLRRDPEGLNRHDALNRTPLDYGFDTLIKTGYPDVVCSLIGKEAWESSLPLRIYRMLKKKDLPLFFWRSFEKLQRRNAKLRWTVVLEELFPLTTSSSSHILAIKGASGERRLLTKDVFRQLSDPRHQVTKEPREVWFVQDQAHKVFIKFYPALVGLEESIGELTRNTIGFGAPHGELFRFPDGRPAWVSQEIPGQTLSWVLSNNPKQLDQLDPVSVTKMILMAMLVNPEDGKPENYIMEPLPESGLYRLTSPDNDQALVPAFVKSKPQAASLFRNQEIVVQVKTILYCLDMMNQPIPEETRQAFLKIDSLDIMRGWLERVQKHSKRYEALYSDTQEKWNIFNQKECFLGVAFQKGTVSHLYSKWERLQDYLAQNNIKLTPLELLSKLEPRLANRYREAFYQKSTVWDRFVWVDGPFYQKKGNSWSTLTPSGSILASQNIALQESIMESILKGKNLGPIQALRELQILIEQKGKSSLSLAHLASNYAREQFLKDFDFQNLLLSEQRQLLIQLQPYGNGLQQLSLKNCQALTNSILQKSFIHGQLVYLDLRGCPNITQEFLPQLAQTNPGLEELNLSGMTQLQWISEVGFLNYSPILFNQLTYLNLNNCSILKAINIKAPHLKYLWADNATQLSIMKIQAPRLQYLSCSQAVINDHALYQLLINSPFSTKINLISCLKISNIGKLLLSAFCNDPHFSTLDLSDQKINNDMAQILEKILIHNTFLKRLILKTVDIKKNELTKIIAAALHHTTTLETLDLSNTWVLNESAVALGQALKNNTTLTELKLSRTYINDRDIEAFLEGFLYNTSLTALYLESNLISNLGLSALAKILTDNTSLVILNLNYNCFGDEGVQELAESLKVNTSLTMLDLNNNYFGDEGNQKLVELLKVNTSLTDLKYSTKLAPREILKDISDILNVLADGED
ncbi:MAG: hypothetical protein K0M45_03310, partial [Candidatus Paracaedibacteraceae bacterium]|nr:hypothetical protein [Candidatus Paracaedibacteraceae bacterium]